jgi:uncharacterized membrane protein YgdD (TMEM256/DUF423 family)
MKLWSVLGALNAVISIAAGAFGAHALRTKLTPERLAVFETAARYQMYHALGLIAVAWLASTRGSAANTAGVSMLVGIVLFSGSLYALTLSGARWLGAITPFGGVAFMVAWVAFAWAVLKG